MRSMTRWLIAAFILLMVVIVVLTTLDTPDAIQLKTQDTSHLRLPPVTVVSVVPSDHRGQISAFAEVKPRWEATITRRPFAAIFGARSSKSFTLRVSPCRHSTGTPVLVPWAG